MIARKPDFFIVGAPKCGTTSLAAWLDDHPQACLSRPKEPNFFGPNRCSRITTLELYEQCFAHALPDHTAIGEASSGTLYYDVAINRILEYQPQAKFILCLRNPINMVISLHNHMYYYTIQEIENFSEAWNSRRKMFPDYHDQGVESGAWYRHDCALGTHLRRLKKIIPQDRLLPVLLEDVVADEASALRRLTDFLGIAPAEASYPRKNTAKSVRSLALKRLATNVVRAKRRLGVDGSLGVGRWIAHINASPRGGGFATLTPELQAMLAKHFEPEIRILERELDRDLSHWLAPSTRSGTE